MSLNELNYWVSINHSIKTLMFYYCVFLGVQPPDREKWEIQNKARKEAELENETAEIAQELEAEGEKIKSSGGKMDELHNILSITQMRINKFKVG